MKIALTVAAAALVALTGCNTTGGTGGFISKYSLQVLPSPTNPADFEVLQKAPNGATDYWCAAGEYAIQRLGVSPAARVYLRKPSGPAEFRDGRNSIGFTISPSPSVQQAARLQGQRFTKTMRNVGENWGAEGARSSCFSPNTGFF